MRKRYDDVRNGVLSPKLMSNPERVAPKNSRPVLESGSAYKTIYLSKAPSSMGHEELAKALEKHVRQMQAELQYDGKLVTKTVKTITGEGDARVTMSWVILGVKNTKHTRRALNGRNVGSVKGGAKEPGHLATQEKDVGDGVPL